MTWFFERCAELPEDVLQILAVVVWGVLAGLLLCGFVLGGFWALRGRAALQTPACRRCRSALRGAGRNLPALCPECGLEIDRPGAVRWLRFRRQPLTVAITAPVVLFGGTLAALLLSVFGFVYVMERIDRIIIDAARAADPSRFAGVAEGLRSRDPGIVDHANHLLEHALHAAPFHDGDVDLALVSELLDEIEQERLPVLRGNPHLAYRTLFALLRLMHDLGALTPEEQERRLAPRLGSMLVTAPSRIRPDSFYSMELSVPEGIPPVRITRLRVNGDAVDERLLRADIITLDAPGEAGMLALDVDWEWWPLPYGMHAGFGVKIFTGSERVTIMVAEGEERMAPLSAEEAATVLERLSIGLVIHRLPGATRDLVVMHIAAGGGVASDGTISLKSAGETLWQGRIEPISFQRRSVLLAPPQGDWPQHLELFYEPAGARDAPADTSILVPDPKDVRLAHDRRFLAERNRSLRGVFIEPWSRRLRSTTEDWSSAKGSPQKTRGYTVERDRHEAEGTPFREISP